jgi:rhomboid family GlyGly-CTERM serine protease
VTPAGPRRWWVRAPATWLAAGAAGLVAVLPDAAAALLFDREAIRAGALWRLGTGHFVHFGAAHLAWNLAVVLAAGLWVESIAPGRSRFFWLSAPWVVGLVLLAGDPALVRFAGLSGLATGLVVLLGAEELRAGGRRRAAGGVLLALAAAKLGAEAAGFDGFVRFADPAIRGVPLAHAAGAGWGAVVALWPGHRRAPAA